MPEVWRMMNAIFSVVHNEAATIRSPSPSRSSSSVTTTISPLAKACRTSGIGWAMNVSPDFREDLAGLGALRQHDYAVVMRGLDPRIHQSSQDCSERMDCR